MCMYLRTGTLVLIKLHKKVDLLKTKVKYTKDRKVGAEENKL